MSTRGRHTAVLQDTPDIVGSPGNIDWCAGDGMSIDEFEGGMGTRAL
jgi:hypothetical protein